MRIAFIVLTTVLTTPAMAVGFQRVTAPDPRSEGGLAAADGRAKNTGEVNIGDCALGI